MFESSMPSGLIADRLHDDDYDYGIPTHCFCGGKAVLEPSRTRTNPGRLFYTCQNTDDGACHIWKWWDEAMMEELTKFRIEMHEYPTLDKMCETHESHRDEILHLYDLHDGNQIEFDRLKAMIAKKMMD